MSKEVLKLAAPFLVNGTNRTELNYDLSELTIDAVSQAQALKSKLTGLSASATPQVAQTDYAFHIALGMKAICAVEPDVSEEDFSVFDEVSEHPLRKAEPASAAQRHMANNFLCIFC